MPAQRFDRRAALVLLLLSVVLFATVAWSDDARFVAGFEDLPLMPGLDQTTDSGTVFDTPAGRVIEAYAGGPVAIGDVDAFYAKTLPQLGWRPLSARRYRREGEILEITPRPTDKALIRVRFYLSPEGAGQP